MDGLVRAKEPDVRLSRELPRPRGAAVREFSRPFMVFCVMRDDVPVMPSCPTVACLISSMNVRSPSLMSAAICLPVLRNASGLASASDSSSHLSSFSPFMMAVISGVVEERLSFWGCVGVSSLRRVGVGCGNGWLKCPRSGESKLRVRRCRDPLKTFRLDVLTPLSMSFRLSISF